MVNHFTVIREKKKHNVGQYGSYSSVFFLLSYPLNLRKNYSPVESIND